MAGLFAAQPKIIDRLEGGLDGLSVKPAETVQSIVEGKQSDKTLYLMLHRYKPLDDDHGTARQWQEEWMTVLAVKAVGGADKAERAAKAAGPILTQVLALLDGWTCRPEVLGRIEVVPAPDPLITDGFAYYPLLFKWRSQTDQAADSAY